MKLHGWPQTAASILTEIDRDGIVVIDAPALCDALLADPVAAATALTGAPPVRTDVVAVAPVEGRASIVESNRDGRLHTDSYPMMSPDLVVMSCHEQSRQGGESVFVDGWAVLDAIRREDPDLYGQLFAVYRAFRFPAYRVYSPTFGVNQGALVCHHATFPTEGDVVGQRFMAWIERAPKLAFRLEPGQVYMIDNHRMLHGRTRFQGPRHLQRLQIWSTRGGTLPPRFAAAAALVEQWRDGLAMLSEEETGLRFGRGRIPAARLAEIPPAEGDLALDDLLRALPPPSAELLARIAAA